MIITAENFSKELLLLIPNMKNSYRKEESMHDFLIEKTKIKREQNKPYKYLISVICEDYLIKYILNVLEKSGDLSKLQGIFDFIEKMALSPDERIIISHQVSVCDYLKREPRIEGLCGPLTLETIRRLRR